MDEMEKWIECLEIVLHGVYIEKNCFVILKRNKFHFFNTGFIILFWKYAVNNTVYTYSWTKTTAV